MNQELAAPVKAITNAFRRGITQIQRICKFAQNASATHMLDVLQPAQGLEKSLTNSEARIKEAYSQSMTAFGRRYADELVNNHVATNRLHALTFNLLEQLNNLDEYIYDPGSFDVGSFPYIQRESERCSDQAIIALGNLHQVLLQAGLQQFQLAQDDRSLLPSARREPVTRDRGFSDVSPMTERSPFGLGIQLLGERSQSASVVPTLANPVASTEASIVRPDSDKREPPPLQTQFPTDHPAENDHHVAVPEPLKLVEQKDKATPKEEELQLINKEEVSQQISAVDQFLARRMISRESFRDELNRLSQISLTISPISPISPHPSVTASASFQTTPNFTDSPVMNSRPNSYLMTTIMETLDRQGPPVPPQDNPWTNSSPVGGEDHGKMLADEPDEARKDSETLGFERTFILPDTFPNTPPDSTGRQSGADEWGTMGLASTRKDPAFGDGIEEGLEAVGPGLVPDPGLILANESHSHKDLTPATSVQSVDYAMRHDSSFFKYGGFCDGAKMTLRGTGGTMKDVTKPAGMYKEMIVMRCTSSNCSFEVDYADFHRDRRLERSGTIKTAGIDDIEYRTRFLVKSHMKTKLADSPIFGCIFCVEENKTLEDQDATVFFSSAQFFRHLQKHPRRLKEVEGIKIIYGPQPENSVDFDLHFLTLDAKVSPTADIKAQLASGGTGYAIINHRPGSRGFKAIDPERRQTLHFAIGARIVGITYPARYNGDWCSGYHDSVKALFPSSAVQLDSPPKDDVTMNPKSSLAATARWDHKPKDSITGWLHFNKKERITHIAYPYQEFWCWSGMNSKGKWGIFPKDYVDGPVDMGNRAEPAMSPGGFASPTRSFASPSTSAHASGNTSGKKFTLSSLSGSSNDSNTSAPEKDPEHHSSHHLFAMKRKTTGLASHFVRRSTVKSHASNASSEYSVASHESGENHVDINKL